MGHVNKSGTLVAAHRKYSLLDMINLNSHPAGCCPAAAQNLLNISMNTETFVRKYTSSLHVSIFLSPALTSWWNRNSNILLCVGLYFTAGLYGCLLHTLTLSMQLRRMSMVQFAYIMQWLSSQAALN